MLPIHIEKMTTDTDLTALMKCDIYMKQESTHDISLKH